jgi:serpin B
MLKNTHLALVNAISFKGNWKVQFSRADTKKKVFSVTKNDNTLVNMMFLHDQRVASMQSPHFTAVRLPYASPPPYPQTSMVAFLPNEDTPIGTVLEEIAGGRGLNVQFSEVKYRHFGFPRFAIDTKFSLGDTLKELGYPVGGVYTEMADGSNEVQSIIHQAFVKVDEDGTEAAAATAVLMTRSRPADPKALVFDRPFVFAVVSDKPDAVLFAGVYSGE